MGSIRYRADRPAWFIDYVAADGRRVREMIGKDKRFARKVLAQREAEAQLGIHRLPARQTVRFIDYAGDWLERGSLRLRPRMLELYEDLIVHHLKPAFGEVRLGTITRRDVETYLIRKVQERRRVKARDSRGRLVRDEAGQPMWIEVPFAPKTINHSLMVLKAILKDAVEHGHLTESPAARVKPMRESTSEDGEALHFLEPAAIARLLSAAENPWRALYLLAVHTGLRRGEALALRWGDLDLEKRLLSVRRSLGRFQENGGYVVREVALKTHYSRRTVDFSEDVRQALLALPAGDDPERDFVFRSQAGGPIDPDNVDRAFKRHLALAELPEIRFHDLRHTHASLLIATNVHPKAIQARLGHASITTTLNTHGHLMPSAYEGVGDRLHVFLQQAAGGESASENSSQDSARRKGSRIG